MHTRNPITDKPVPQSPGTGKLGLGYGLCRNTPGLPVQNPSYGQLCWKSKLYVTQ